MYSAVQILLNATCRRDDEGRPVGVVGIGQDITDARARNEAEMRQREAEAAQDAQSTISAHVYHEIRNVVGAVLALAERASEAVDLALEETSGELIKKLPEEVRQLTEHQRLVCAHAVNTLNDMLDVSRMENGTYKPSSMVIDLGALCNQAAKLQGPRLKSGVQLHLDCPQPGALIVLSDPALLLQYLTNLLSNAAKFFHGLGPRDDHMPHVAARNAEGLGGCRARCGGHRARHSPKVGFRLRFFVPRMHVLLILRFFV